MAAPVSQDLRCRLVQAVEASASAHKAAWRFAVSLRAAEQDWAARARTGSTAPARMGGCRKPLLAGHEELLRELTTAKDNSTLAEIAPLVLDGPMNGSVATSWSWTTWVLTRWRASEAIRAAGASVLYLPPYSPDLNPIEHVFAELEAPLRGAAARINDAPWTTIGQLLDRFSPPSAATTSTTQSMNSCEAKIVKHSETQRTVFKRTPNLTRLRPRAPPCLALPSAHGPEAARAARLFREPCPSLARPLPRPACPRFRVRSLFSARPNRPDIETVAEEQRRPLSTSDA